MRHPAPASSAKAPRRPAPPRRPRVPAPDEMAAALRMFAQGATAPQAVKALRISRATAYRWWGEHWGGQAEPADLAEPAQPMALPAATTPGAEPVRQPTGRDAEQEWATWLAMAAAYRR